ncbi:MAG: tonB-system energizer ExbB, partial [Bradyrhizobium sp.]
MFRTILKAITALMMLSLVASASAQQPRPAEPAASQAPAANQPVQPAPMPSAVAPSAPVPPSASASQSVPPGPADAPATAADATARPLKSTTPGMRELSPWSMFLAADIIVKAVMVGLAFASLVTWTVFVAKMIELSFVRRKLRGALAKIKDARSLAEAQFSLGAKDSVLSALLAAAMGEARLSAGISSDEGIKERAASKFAEIVRAEGRR